MATEDNLPPRMDRRRAIKWMMTAAAGAVLADRVPRAGAAPFDSASKLDDGGTGPIGYGSDLDLTKEYKPGDLWPLTFTDAQRRAAAALCDVIIPADSRSPAASSVGVQDFIDEWISGPYPDNHRDRPVILKGLAWIDAESQKRFGLDFADGIMSQKTAICDDICYEPDAKDEFGEGARFFKRFRDLTAGGFYTTAEGMKDLPYIGNVPLATFDGPPPEVLQKLGLA